MVEGWEDRGQKEMIKVEILMKFCCAVCDVIFFPF